MGNIKEEGREIKRKEWKTKNQKIKERKSKKERDNVRNMKKARKSEEKLEGKNERRNMLILRNHKETKKRKHVADVKASDYWDILLTDTLFVLDEPQLPSLVMFCKA